MHSAFRSLPNLGCAVVALANNDESQQIMADRVQSHLIFGSKQTVFYFDLRIDCVFRSKRSLNTVLFDHLVR